MPIDNKVNINLVVLGAHRAGKSSIIERWKRPCVKPHPEETIAIEVCSNTIRMNNQLYMVRTWDTSGRDMYESLLSRYIYNADCCVIVYDTTSIESWMKVKQWVNVIKKDHGVKINICLIGNKIDRESMRIVHKIDVQNYIQRSEMVNIIYSECSALSGENCIDTFRMIIDYTKHITKKVWSVRPMHVQSSKCLIV
jgi:small GTP-binding protein